jgi:hypothetical protein
MLDDCAGDDWSGEVVRPVRCRMFASRVVLDPGTGYWKMYVGSAISYRSSLFTVASLG